MDTYADYEITLPRNPYESPKKTFYCSCSGNLHETVTYSDVTGRTD